MHLKNRQKNTLRHSTNKDIFKLISTNNRMVIQDGSGSDVPAKNIISDIEKGLFPGFVLVHVEGVVDLGGKDSVSPYLNGVDG